jgi:acyl-CoA thioester hydrolase
MRQRATVAFRVPMRVYWEDTDAAGIVFYANYLKYFERARTEWLRGLGFGQEALRRDAGIAFVVSDVALPAPGADDDGSTSASTCSTSARRILSRAHAGSSNGGRSTIRIGCIELGTFRPCRIPRHIRELSTMNQDFSTSARSARAPSYQ